MSSITLANLPLHDAVLKELKIDWSNRSCVAELSTFVDGLTGEAQARRILWSEVDEVVVPHRSPWGPSVHINAGREENGWYILEMQSGDLIRVAARAVEFT